MSIVLKGNYDWKELTLLDFLNEGNVPSYWVDFFTQPEIQDEISKISGYLEKESKSATIYPLINQTFRAFINPDKIKVVILGQDPYHNGNAIGLCFSVKLGGYINPSLRSIYTELESEGFSPKRTGDLTHWADQGCMMLNTALTVEKSNAGEHTHIWYSFTEKVVQYLSQFNLVWLLMGKHAYAFYSLIQKNMNNKVVITSHPMPLAAPRPFRQYPAFFGSNAFQTINTHLSEQNKKPINW